MSLLRNDDTLRSVCSQAAKAQARALAADGEAARIRAELAEANESLAMAKSLFARAAQANDLEEQLKVRCADYILVRSTPGRVAC